MVIFVNIKDFRASLHMQVISYDRFGSLFSFRLFLSKEPIESKICITTKIVKKSMESYNK